MLEAMDITITLELGHKIQSSGNSIWTTLIWKKCSPNQMHVEKLPSYLPRMSQEQFQDSFGRP